MCKFNIFHKWSNWSEPKLSIWYRAVCSYPKAPSQTGQDYIKLVKSHQTRACLRCGLSQKILVDEFALVDDVAIRTNDTHDWADTKVGDIIGNELVPAVEMSSKDLELFSMVTGLF